MKFLAGDIGGTNARFMISEVEAEGYNVLFSRTLPSAERPSFESALTDFLEMAGDAAVGVVDACFALAGPVKDGSGRVTNLHWVPESAELTRRFGLSRVHLMNDFEAVGWGLQGIGPEGLHCLQEGKPAGQQTRVLIGAGTGLGQALMTWCGDHYRMVTSEGGHADFAPRGDLQVALLRYLSRRYPHVSYERLLSGLGLENIFGFLREHGDTEPVPALAGAMEKGEGAAAISRFALSGEDPLAVAALDLFITIYGAQAGNLALTCLPRGGLFVAGGIAAKILPRLKKGGFMQAFLHKGRMGALLETIPVNVVLEPKVGLLGAAYAARHLSNYPE
jgi:glucokinase